MLKECTLIGPPMHSPREIWDHIFVIFQIVRNYKLPSIVDQPNRFGVEDFGQLRGGIVSPTMRTNQHVGCLEYFLMLLVRYPLRPFVVNPKKKHFKMMLMTYYVNCYTPFGFVHFVESSVSSELV